MTKTKVALSIDSEVLEAVKLLASGDSRSLSAYVNKVLTDHLHEKQAADKPTKGKGAK